MYTYRFRAVGALAVLGTVLAISLVDPVDAAVRKAPTKNTKAASAPSKPAPASAPSPAPAPAPTPAPAASSGVSSTGISPERCAANKKAGKITYLSGFDYAAAASIVEMIVADAKGYYAKMCLDVDVKASFSTANYGLVADNKAQFASAGSYTELLKQTPKDASLVMVYNLGKTAIDGLMVRDSASTVTSLFDLRNKTIGVKGDLPPSIQAMLFKVAGMKREVDYKTVPVDGFNPLQHFQLPIDALPGFKSNEPGQLDRASFAYRLFDPLKYGITGSFGNVYTNAKFLKENPTAVEDFVRASLKGLADSITDPDAATAIAVKRINDNGNRNFLSPVGEQYRWRVEAKIVTDTTPKGTAVGQIVPKLLDDQATLYTAAGVFTSKPSITGTYDEAIVKAVVDSSNQVIWPK